MELNKDHRSALLDSLEDSALQFKKLSDLLSWKNTPEDIKPGLEIGMFLMEQRINLIKESLINNEIDF